MRNRWPLLVAVGLFVMTAFAQPAQAMHISEGILPAQWAGLWFVVAAPFVLWGLWVIRGLRKRNSSYMPMLAMVGAAVFLVSCMPIPIPVAGTCSHPCGTGMAAILVGPGPTIVITAIALLFQALFMAHGGLSTLGANICSMGVMGALIGWASFRVVRRLTGSTMIGAFAAGILSDWATYAGTSIFLALGLGGENLRFGTEPATWELFGKIAIAFMPTQIPLGVLEGVLTAGAYAFIARRRPELIDLQVQSQAVRS